MTNMNIIHTAQVLLLCLAMAGGSSVEWSAVVKIGSDKEGHFWRPKGGVGFSRSKAAITIERHSHNCSCDPEPEQDVAKCRTCGKKETVMFTADGGTTFQEFTGSETFCGEQGVPSVQEDGEKHHLCPEESQQVPEEDSVTIPLSSWRISEAGLIENAKMHVTADGGSIKVWTHSIKREKPISVKLGDNVLNMPDKLLMFRVATVKFADEEIPVVLKSQDSGKSWLYVSQLPNHFGYRNSIERGGENVIRLHFQNETSIYRQVSRTLGRKWENATELPLTGMPKVLHSKFSTIIFGGRPSPFLMTQGAKKGSQQYFSVAQEHNTIADDADDFPATYLKPSPGDDNEHCSNHPYPTEDCHSSGMTTAIEMDEDEANNVTSYLVCYDKLGNGWHGPSDGKEDAVYCLKAHLNESAESIEAETKARKKEERKQREREARERAEKAAQENRERRKREKREKDKKLKEKLLLWNKIDNEANVKPARAFEEEDGELVIIRDYHQFAEYSDFMDDSVGVPLPGQTFEEEEPKQDEPKNDEAQPDGDADVEV